MRRSACWITVPEIPTDRSPFSAKGWDVGQKIGSHHPYLGSVEPIAFAQVRRTIRAIEQEHSFTSRADDMHMRRGMIIRIDRDPQAADAQDRWHC